MEDGSRQKGDSASKGPSGKKERIVVSFDDDADEKADGKAEEPTEILDPVEDNKDKSRIVFVDDSPKDDYDEYDDEYEDEAEPSRPAAAPVPPPPAEPGFLAVIFRNPRFRWLAVAGVAGLFLVSLFTVYGESKWTGILPDPKVGAKGLDGDRGNDGRIGPDGDPGRTGSQGATGAQGVHGPKGDRGVVQGGDF